MSPQPPSPGERAWRYLAVAIVATIVLLVNYDPIWTWLPNIAQGGGADITEAGRQALALAGVLLLLSLILTVVQLAFSAPSGFESLTSIVSASAIAGIGIFLLMLATANNSRALLAYASIAVLGVACLAAFLRAPSLTFANVSPGPIVTIVAAVALVALYGFVLSQMFAKTDTTVANEWERMIALFSGVEAIGFAAVGALLGHQIQKGQTSLEADRANENGENLEAAKQVAGEAVDAAALAAPGDLGGAAAQATEAAVLRARLASIPGRR